jgi:hypothetical protein
MKRDNNVMILFFLISACGNHASATTESSSGLSTETAGASTNSTEGFTSGSTNGVPTSSTTAAEGGPVFLSFKSNVSKITEGESLIFTALLTDPDGVSDIIGGSLLSEDEMIDYGPFVAAGQAGAFSISVSWSQIHQVAPISFENADLPTVFRARFFDQAGNAAIKDAGITLFCDDGSACDGSCTDLGLDGFNCGACGHTCTSMSCESGACTPTWSECASKADGFSTCSEICNSIGATCAEAQCGGYTVNYYIGIFDCMNNSGSMSSPEPCDQIQNWASPSIKCCCTDPN